MIRQSTQITAGRVRYIKRIIGEQAIIWDPGTVDGILCLKRNSHKVTASRESGKHNSKSTKKVSVVEVWEGMTVKELALAAGRPKSLLLTALNSGALNSGPVGLNSKIEDRSLITSAVHLMGLRPLFKAQTSATIEDKDAYPRPPPIPEVCTPRPPVVAVLGHVDHGKTTLLDALRSSRMVDEEYGGITQHLAAFSVSLADVAQQAGLTDVSSACAGLMSDCITFLDTPGHAAFSSIRARGAKLTDLIILVVAADDGVMPQTVESIRFAKEAKTPLVVAINKIDKRETDVGRVMEELATHGVVVEQLGGENQAVEISALRRLNLQNLLEAVILQAEMMQLKADPTGPAEGVVLESKLEHGTGRVATCLVTRGIIRKTPGSGPLVADEAICNPRLLFNDLGQRVDAVRPGYVVKVAGWKELPSAGSVLLELESSSRATEVIRYRRSMRMQKKATEDHAAYMNRMAPYQAQYEEFIRERSKVSRSEWRKFDKHRPDFLSLVESDRSRLPILPLLIKTDVHGSLEAIQKLLSTCPSDQCVVELGQVGVGPLTESEVEHAEALGATILLFNVDALTDARNLAKSKGVTVKQFNIIYRLAEEVRDMMDSLIPPRIVEKIVGEAEILQLFQVKEPRSSGKPLRVPVAGCRCTKGYLLAGQPGTKSFVYEDLSPDVIATHFRVIRPKEANAKATTRATDQPITPEGADPLNTGTVLVSRATCRSMRHERTVVESIRKGVECGLTLITTEQPATMNAKQVKSTGTSRVNTENASEFFVSDWQPGDIIQCYVLVPEPQKVDWEFEKKSSVVDDREN